MFFFKTTSARLSRTVDLDVRLWRNRSLPSETVQDRTRDHRTGHVFSYVGAWEIVTVYWLRQWRTVLKPGPAALPEPFLFVSPDCATRHKIVFCSCVPIDIADAHRSCSSISYADSSRRCEWTLCISCLMTLTLSSDLDHDARGPCWDSFYYTSTRILLHCFYFT